LTANAVRHDVISIIVAAPDPAVLRQRRAYVNARGRSRRRHRDAMGGLDLREA